MKKIEKEYIEDLIIFIVDNGCCRQYIIKNVLELTEEKYSQKQINRVINSLLKNEILTDVDNDDWIQVKAWI